VSDAWTKRGYPPIQFLTFAYDDTDEAPVLDVSDTLREARRQGNGGAFVYRLERLPEDQWSNPNQPAYGNEQFVEQLR